MGLYPAPSANVEIQLRLLLRNDERMCSRLPVVRLLGRLYCLNDFAH